MFREARQLQQDIANLYLQFPTVKDDDEVLRVDMLEGATNIMELLTMIVRAAQDAKALKEGTKARLDELKARQERFGRRLDFLRALILKLLSHAELKKIELPEATLSLRNGSPQLVGDIDPLMLPDELCHITREPDKVKIKAALAAGQVVPGYMLSNGEPTLAVNIK